MPRVSQNALVRYSLAVSFVGIAFFATTQFPFLAANTPFALFFVAVLASKYLFGRSAAVLDVILSTLAVSCFILLPTNHFQFDTPQAIQIGRFVLVSAVVIWLMTTVKKHGRTIRESENRYDFLFESNRYPMWVIDPQTSRFLAVNDAAISCYGFSKDEFLCMTAEDLSVDDPDLQPDQNDAEIVPGAPLLVSKHKRKDGTSLQVETVAHDLVYNDRPARLIHVIDVTERINVAAAQRASEARLLKVFGNCPVAVAVNRWSDGAYVDVNAEFSKLTGWHHDEIIGRTTVDRAIVPIETAVTMREHLSRHNSLNDIEMEITTQSGETLNVIAGGVFVEMLGEPHVITTFVNITERRQTSEELRASEHRLQMVTENARVGLVMINSDRRFTFANAAYAKIFDLAKSNVTGCLVADIHPSLYEQQISPSLDRAFNGDSLKFELHRSTPDGDFFYDVQYQPTKVNGSVSSVVAVVTDITFRHRAELAREASEERYRTLFEYAPDGIVITDPQSFYLDANESLCQMLGYERYQIIGLHAADVVVPKEIPHLHQTLNGLNADLEYYQEWQFRRRDGSIFPAEVTATIMPDGNTLTVIRDITDRKQLEDQFLQAQKMEAIGVLAGGVVHDFNNILTAISGYSDLMLENMSPTDPLRNYIMEIKDAGIRAADLTGQLLSFSRKRVMMPSVHNLNISVTDIEKMLRRIVKENIEFDIVLDPKLGNIKADPSQISQVIVNLVVNSGDAMPDGGKLTIQTKNVSVRGDLSDNNIGVNPGQYVELTISDTGYGMDPNTQKRLFEPFFTTKEIGKGTGLGLSTAYGIIRQSGGDISVSSELGKGSTFKIYLPIVDEAVDVPSVIKTTQKVENGSGTVLVVEDELAVRTLIKNVLTRSGYKVLAADSGMAAIEICNNFTDRIDLLLTDMIMPNMGGTELTDAVIKLRPDIKLLYMSGYAGDSMNRNGKMPLISAYIEKPFTPDELVTKINEVLSAEIISSRLSELASEDSASIAVRDNKA